jgi:hypothetical protein
MLPSVPSHVASAVERAASVQQTGQLTQGAQQARGFTESSKKGDESKLGNGESSFSNKRLKELEKPANSGLTSMSALSSTQGGNVGELASTNSQENPPTGWELQSTSRVPELRDSSWLQNFVSDPQQFRRFENAMESVLKTKSGRQLFNEIDREATQRNLVVQTNYNADMPTTVGLPKGEPESDSTNGKGGDAIWFMNYGEDTDDHIKKGLNDDQLDSINTMHEMRHVLSRLTGTQLFEESNVNGVLALNEEHRAVGVGPYRDEPLSENAYRAEAGLPQRPFY